MPCADMVGNNVYLPEAVSAGPRETGVDFCCRRTVAEGDQIRITISGLRLMRSRDLYLNGKHVPVKSMESFFESCFCIVETSVFPKGDSVTVEIAKRYPYIVPLPIYRSNAIEMECSFF